MSAQIELAAKGARATAQGVKVALYAVCVLVLCGAAFWFFIGQKQRDERLKGLEDFKVGYENSQRVQNAMDAAYEAARLSKEQQDAQQPQVVVVHDKETEEARREDPTVDDFLAAPIPKRLRDADARARRARRLEQD